MTTSLHSQSSTRWLWITAIWSAVGLCDASQTVLFMHALDAHLSRPTMFVCELVSWLPWALATPFIIRVARRHPLSRDTFLWTFGVHLATFVAVSLAAETWFATLQMLYNPWNYAQPPTFGGALRTSFPYQMPFFLFVYSLMLVVIYVLDSRDRMARQMAETARLKQELSGAQLAALRRQMEPHFIYNTLNSIAGLVRDRSNDAAVNMLVGLSEFMRRATEDSHRAEVNLAEEVEYLQRYLDIQKMRFGDRLHASVDIPAGLMGAQVPNLLLQPLVENAIKHGIAKRVAGGVVRISGASEGGKLCLRVYNDGPSVPIDLQATRTGVGIGNLRTRLQILHGSESDLQLMRTDTGGVEVVVILPLRVV